jgi:hypothetical protein
LFKGGARIPQPPKSRAKKEERRMKEDIVEKVEQMIQEQEEKAAMEMVAAAWNICLLEAIRDHFLKNRDKGEGPPPNCERNHAGSSCVT